MPQARGEKRLIGGDAEGRGLFEAVNKPASCLLAGRAMADELCDHRVIKWRNFGTGLQRVLDAQSIRHLPQRHPSRLRHEIAGHILRTQPHLDRVPRKLNILLPKAKWS